VAKLSAHGTELVRYFSPRKRALISVRSDGTTFCRRPYLDWKIYSRFAVRFDPPVLRALSAEFCCSEQALKRDLRAVATEAALRARLDSLRRSSRFR